MTERRDHGDVDVLVPQRATLELLALQSSILARAASGEDVHDLLDAICRMIEDPFAGVRCTILLVEGPALRHGAAPGMPEAFTEAIDGEHWGPDRGSCGTTAYTGRPTLVEDIATDERWVPWRELALAHGLQACWSVPVFSRDGRVIATFAAYATEPRMPDDGELELLEHASHLVSVLLEQQRDRDQLENVTARLEDTNRELLAASRAKDDFLSMTSHELRTPLTPMIGMLETLQMRWTQLADEQRRSLVDVVARQAVRLHHLVDDLLTMSAAAAGELRTRPQVIDVRPAIELALTSMLGPEPDVAVEAAPDLQVLCDPRHLQQMLENYLSNAIKYADDGPVLVSARREAEEVSLCVIDDGDGIDPTLVTGCSSRSPNWTPATDGPRRAPASGWPSSARSPNSTAAAPGTSPRTPAGRASRSRCRCQSDDTPPVTTEVVRDAVGIDDLIAGRTRARVVGRPGCRSHA